MLTKIFGSRKPKTDINLKVVFHKEANGHVEHGTICASHTQFALKREPVRFAFVGIEGVPQLDARILAHITDEAEKQGYTVHFLRSYATVFTVMPAPKRIDQLPYDERIANIEKRRQEEERRVQESKERASKSNVTVPSAA